MCSHVEADSIEGLHSVTDNKNGTVILSRQQETRWHFPGELKNNTSHIINVIEVISATLKRRWKYFSCYFQSWRAVKSERRCIRSSTRSCIRKKVKPRRTCLLLVIRVHFERIDQAKPICSIFTFNMSKQCLFAKLYQTKQSHRKKVKYQYLNYLSVSNYQHKLLEFLIWYPKAKWFPSCFRQ